MDRPSAVQQLDHEWLERQLQLQQLQQQRQQQQQLGDLTATALAQQELLHNDEPGYSDYEPSDADSSHESEIDYESDSSEPTTKRPQHNATTSTEHYRTPMEPPGYDSSDPLACGIRVIGEQRVQLINKLLDPEMHELIYEQGRWKRVYKTVATKSGHVTDSMSPGTSEMVAQQVGFDLGQKSTAFDRGRGRTTTPAMLKAIDTGFVSGRHTYSVDDLQRGGIARAVAEVLVAVSTKHCDRMLARIEEALRQDPDGASKIDVTVTAAACDPERGVLRPVYLAAGRDNKIKVFKILPGQTIAFPGLSAFLVPHQMFVPLGSYSVRFRYLWLDAVIKIKAGVKEDDMSE